ncbi:Chemotaxis protein methyltransferase CheR [Candidatus Magnetaquicoccaceae bacterium FCR-1]|uniref:Chemotaxis protein methyltransferase CheR n=1 Tax=Candidatus Magnetaquiglobus chichijimensis TaxID=3141448 RepID=A0ABQ0C8F8_9PROT
MTLDLAPFKALIKNGCGLVFETSNEANLVRVLHERLGALNLSPRLYLDHLRASDQEFRELVNRLTINETFFFREPEQLRFLVERIVPRLLSRRLRLAPVRILSVGCSSGEEIYSLVMALNEHHGEGIGARFTFAGCDIDGTILAKARRGCYSDFSFRGVERHWRERFFTSQDKSHCLHERIKQAVTFHEFNVVTDPIPTRFKGIDILLFRNVSIYFDPATRLEVLRRIASMLNEEGVLIVAASETLANDLGVLRLVEEEGLFYFINAARSEEAPSPVPLVASPPLFPIVEPHPTIGRDPAISFPLPVVDSPSLDAALQAARSDVSDGRFDQARRLVDEKRHDEARTRLDELLASDPGHVGASLLRAYLLIERREFAQAESVARMALASNPDSIDALLLLGVAAKWQKKSHEAIAWFKQAVYRAHHCWPAHYHLAELHRFGHEFERARHGYRVVLQLLSEGGGETGLNYLPPGLPLAEVRFLSAHQLEKMRAVGSSSGVMATHGP